MDIVSGIPFGGDLLLRLRHLDEQQCHINDPAYSRPTLFRHIPRPQRCPFSQFEIVAGRAIPKLRLHIDHSWIHISICRLHHCLQLLALVITNTFSSHFLNLKFLNQFVFCFFILQTFRGSNVLCLQQSVNVVDFLAADRPYYSYGVVT